jgi:hypothetical protein
MHVGQGRLRDPTQPGPAGSSSESVQAAGVAEVEPAGDLERVYGRYGGRL